jgi:hypothetical protein
MSNDEVEQAFALALGALETIETIWQGDADLVTNVACPLIQSRGGICLGQNVSRSCAA